MRAAMSGYVMNISSTSGIRGAPCYDFYTGKYIHLLYVTALYLLCVTTLCLLYVTVLYLLHVTALYSTEISFLYNTLLYGLSVNLVPTCFVNILKMFSNTCNIK